MPRQRTPSSLPRWVGPPAAPSPVAAAAAVELRRACSVRCAAGRPDPRLALLPSRAPAARPRRAAELCGPAPVAPAPQGVPGAGLHSPHAHPGARTCLAAARCPAARCLDACLDAVSAAAAACAGAAGTTAGGARSSVLQPAVPLKPCTETWAPLPPARAGGLHPAGAGGARHLRQRRHRQRQDRGLQPALPRAPAAPVRAWLGARTRGCGGRARRPTGQAASMHPAAGSDRRCGGASRPQPGPTPTCLLRRAIETRSNKRVAATYVLVLTPVRELAVQARAGRGLGRGLATLGLATRGLATRGLEGAGTVGRGCALTGQFGSVHRRIPTLVSRCSRCARWPEAGAVHRHARLNRR